MQGTSLEACSFMYHVIKVKEICVTFIDFIPFLDP